MGQPGLTAPSTSASSDLARHHHLFPPLSPLEGGKGLGSMNIDDFLQNIYSVESPPVADPVTREAGKTVDEMWKEISSEKKVESGGAPANAAAGYAAEATMTLEDYLARAGVVADGDGCGVERQQQEAVDAGMMGSRMDYGQQQEKEDGLLGFGDAGVDGGDGGRIGWRGRRRLVQDQADKVAQQRQRRMIKNRESAARSRERKQAYTVELESKVAQLEEKNSALRRDQEEQRRKRLKHLLETRIPVVERKNPRRRLRKTLSLHW